MHDDSGRCIEYVRISLTDHCNLRCRYCMPEHGIPPLQHTDILSYEEIIRLVHCFAYLGIRKIRLTGGEPLTRPDISNLVSGIKSIPGIKKVVLTTNGVLLSTMAAKLKAAGLDYVNVSLDTLSEATFFHLTRRHNLTAVKAGLAALKEAGFQHTRINCVPLQDINEADIPKLASLARDDELNVRFIELMPVGCAYKAGFKRLPMTDVKNILQSAFGPLNKISTKDRLHGPAEYVQPKGFKGKIGFIDALEHKFCSACNRMRLTADGFLKPCLHSSQGLNLKTLLRQGITDDALCQAIAETIRTKPTEHHFSLTRSDLQDKRYMYQVGG